MATSEAAGIQHKVGAHQAIRFMQLLGGGVLRELYTPQHLTNRP